MPPSVHRNSDRQVTQPDPRASCSQEDELGPHVAEGVALPSDEEGTSGVFDLAISRPGGEARPKPVSILQGPAIHAGPCSVTADDVRSGRVLYLRSIERFTALAIFRYPASLG
jgi:hypothetical protein